MRAGGVFTRFSDSRHKPVAAFGDGLDVAVAVFAILEKAAQQIDGLSQVIFFDGRVRPNAVHQLIFGEQPAIAFGEGDEGIKHTGRQVNAVLAAPEDTLARIELEGTELV